MKNKNKVISFILCFCTVFSLMAPGFCAGAEVVRKGTITVDTVSALPGDSVIVSLTINDNPGIMAMTFSITYDSSALTYEKFYMGYLLDYTVADHPDRNLIRFVNCESFNKFQNKAIVSLQFKVKDTAAGGLHPISVQYGEGDFCNWKLDKIMPSIISGGVDVALNESNCPHKHYGKWKTVAEAGCNRPGAQQRACADCGHVEQKEIPQTAHSYEKDWVIDTPATATANGSMSRHCIYCGNRIDVLSFSLKQAEDSGMQNEPGLSPTDPALSGELMKEQHPEGSQEDKTPSKDDPVSSDTQQGTDSEKTPDAPSANASLTERLLSLLSEGPYATLALIAFALSVISLFTVF